MTVNKFIVKQSDKKMKDSPKIASHDSLYILTANNKVALVLQVRYTNNGTCMLTVTVSREDGHVLSRSGRASGGGYHKMSVALGNALKRLGYTFTMENTPDKVNLTGAIETVQAAMDVMEAVVKFHYPEAEVDFFMN